MTPSPPGPWSEHLSQLRAAVRRLTPEAAQADFCFFEIRHASRLLDADVIPASALRTWREIVPILADAVDQKREWVNLSGVGFLLDGRYAVSIDYSRKAGALPTVMEIRGSPLRADGQPRRYSGLLVGLVEQIAAFLASRYRPDLDERLIQCYACRARGDWAGEQLAQWSPEEIREFVDAVDCVVKVETVRAKSTSPPLPFYPEYIERLQRLRRRAQGLMSPAQPGGRN
jgi:hypothetical protein